MINLIPKEERKRMTMDLYYRISLIFILMLGFVFLVGSVAIVPAYLLSSSKNSLVNIKLDIQKKEPLPLAGEQSLGVVKDINQKLNTLDKIEANKFVVSTRVINAILLKKRPDIKITQILYENDPIFGRKISLTGTAPSRAILLLFRQSLQDNSAFKNVDLPISNFIKGSDIQFYLSLIPV